MRGLAIAVGTFLLFLGVAKLRFVDTSCQDIVDRMERGFCVAKSIEVNAASDPLPERIRQLEMAVDSLPDHYLLIVKLAESYALNDDKLRALALFDHAESLIRPSRPLIADEIHSERERVARSIGSR